MTDTPGELTWDRLFAAEDEVRRLRTALRVTNTRPAPDTGLREAIDAALHELGVPSDDYPAPIANAVAILRAALADSTLEPTDG